MTLTRWKLMAGVLGLSIGGLAALADPAPKKATLKPTDKPCVDCPSLPTPPLPVQIPNPADVPQLAPAVNPAPLTIPLTIPTTRIDIPVPVVSTPADIVPATPIKLMKPAATVAQAETAPMPRKVEPKVQVIDVTVPMDTAPIIPTAATTPTAVITPPAPELAPAIPLPTAAVVPAPQPTVPAPKPTPAVVAAPQPTVAPAPVAVTKLEPVTQLEPVTKPEPTPAPAPAPEPKPAPQPIASAPVLETPAKQPIPQTESLADPVREKKLKVLLHMGDQRPRFEVKDGDEIYLKVICDTVDVKAPTGKTDSLSTMRAIGRCSFVTPGGEGACDELTVIPGTGQVTVSGHVRFRYQWGRAETEVSGEKMTFRLGTTPAAFTATDDTPSVAVPASYTKPR
ncbi:MAG: hypothetical protein LC104_05135 [Bacteroidales bacterium]|nr:hypothetical protein [Bacteroidales bacterium]